MEIEGESAGITINSFSGSYEKILLLFEIGQPEILILKTIFHVI